MKTYYFTLIKCESSCEDDECGEYLIQNDNYISICRTELKSLFPFISKHIKIDISLEPVEGFTKLEISYNKWGELQIQNRVILEGTQDFIENEIFQDENPEFIYVKVTNV